ncbi:hypothetical protein D3C85_1693970 [compost metagenome]
MACQLRDLPGREVAEDLRGTDAQLAAQRLHFGIDVDGRAGAGVAQFLDLGFQIGDGLLEVEVVRIHGKPVERKGRSVAEGPRSTRTQAFGWAWSIAPTVGCT